MKSQMSLMTLDFFQMVLAVNDGTRDFSLSQKLKSVVGHDWDEQSQSPTN